MFLVLLDISDLYLFYLIAFLNPVSIFSIIYCHLEFDELMTGTYNFVSFILNVAPVEAFIAGLAGLQHLNLLHCQLIHY